MEKSKNEIFIEKARKIHNDKYDYSKVEYINAKTKVCIKCPIHGEFWQTPTDHLSGKGCKYCANNVKYTSENFVEKSKKIHGNKYDYSNVNYVNNSTKVCIICPEHGEFWQTPDNHLRGHSCPKCNTSKLENEIRSILSENNIKFEEQKKFEWMGLLSLDFYITEYNIAIECQGIQHFEPNDHFGGNDVFNDIKERDMRKKELCRENGVTILYYANYSYDFPYEVITDNKILIEKITNNKIYKHK